MSKILAVFILVLGFVVGGADFGATGGDVDFAVVIGILNVVDAAGFAAGTVTGFVCPKVNFPVVFAVVGVGVGVAEATGNAEDIILNPLIESVLDVLTLPPKLASNPPKADVNSPNALPEPIPPPPTLGVDTGAGVAGTDCTVFGAYNFKILFFKSFRDTGTVAPPAMVPVVGGNCGALCVRTGESNSKPRRL